MKFLDAHARSHKGLKETSTSSNFKIIFFFLTIKRAQMPTLQHIICFSLSCFPCIHRLNYFSAASNKYSYMILFCNSEFLSCCFLLCLRQKKYLPCLFWDDVSASSSWVKQALIRKVNSCLASHFESS